MLRYPALTRYAREEGLHIRNFAVSIAPESEWFIARCPGLNVTSQGRTLEEAQANIREAIVLYIESFGLPAIAE